MSRARWRDRFGPPLTVLGSALLLAAVMPASDIHLAALAAGRTESAPAACPSTPAAATQGRNGHVPTAGRRLHLESLITARGELTGRLLGIEGDGGPATTISLPTESFVGQRAGDVVVYTSYTPSAGSAVRLLDVATGCDTKLAAPAEIVRSALVDPSGSSVYVHSVTSVGRLDNGVLRIDLATGESALVVPPLPPSDAFGPTFGTELRWSLAGTALAVQSCGFEACRTRVLVIASGATTTFDRPGQGALIGLTDAHLVTFADCPGLPCAVVSTDLQTGNAVVLADQALSASLAAGADGTATVTIETAAGMMEVVQ